MPVLHLKALGTLLFKDFSRKGLNQLNFFKIRLLNKLSVH
jgi:hypothetical protein